MIRNKNTSEVSSETPEIVYEIYDTAEESLKKISFILNFTPNDSYYHLLDSGDLSDYDLNMARILTNSKSNYYLDKENNLSIKESNFSDTKYLISNSEKQNWILTKETRKIDKYTCYKAILNQQIETSRGIKNQKIVAWFTPQINIPFGPDGYYGLPGLIIQYERAYKSGKTITYLTNLEFTEDVSVEEPTEGISMTKEAFDKMIKEAIGNARDLKK